MSKSDNVKATIPSGSLLSQKDISEGNIKKAVGIMAEAIVQQFGKDPIKWDSFKIKLYFDQVLGDEIITVLVDNLGKTSKRGEPRVINISVFVVEVCDALAITASPMGKVMLYGAIPANVIRQYKGTEKPKPKVAVENLDRLIYQLTSTVTNAVAAQYIMDPDTREKLIPHLTPETESLIKSLRTIMLQMSKSAYDFAIE